MLDAWIQNLYLFNELDNIEYRKTWNKNVSIVYLTSAAFGVASHSKVGEGRRPSVSPHTISQESPLTTPSRPILTLLNMCSWHQTRLKMEQPCIKWSQKGYRYTKAKTNVFWTTETENMIFFLKRSTTVVSAVGCNHRSGGNNVNSNRVEEDDYL